MDDAEKEMNFVFEHPERHPYTIDIRCDLLRQSGTDVAILFGFIEGLLMWQDLGVTYNRERFGTETGFTLERITQAEEELVRTGWVAKEYFA